MCLVDIVQHMWRTGEILQELGWTVLVLIPKWTIDTRGIGLLETLCKMVETLMDTRLRASLHLHDVFHGLQARRGMGTATIELKLAQEISSVDRYPLFLVFLDLRKAYDTVERDHLLQTL